MPISTVIYLIPTEDVLLRPTMGHHAHAAFLSLLKAGNPQTANEIHAASGQKPFTVSPLIAKTERCGDHLRIRAGTECWLRFTFLLDELFSDFGSAFLTSQRLPQIRLGEATFEVSRIISSDGETPSWSGNTTYEQLMESAQTKRQLYLRFYSPTAFRQMTPRGQRTRNQAMIDLVRCYQSWINKWNAFAPVPIDKQTMLEFIGDYAEVIKYDARTRMLDFGNHKEIGFVGRCTYGFPTPNSGSEAQIWMANVLADFAFYCGTGYKTTMGMGQTRRSRRR